MTIRRGQDWGEQVPFEEAVPILADDAALFGHLNRVEARLGIDERVAVISGDLARTLGSAGTAERFRIGADCLRVPIDVGVVEHDAGSHRFVGHLVLRRSSEWTFDRPQSLVADGVSLGRTRRLRVRLIEDSLTVHV